MSGRVCRPYPHPHHSLIARATKQPARPSRVYVRIWEPLLLQVVSRETEQSDEAEEAGSADFVRGTPERAR